MTPQYPEKQKKFASSCTVSCIDYPVTSQERVVLVWSSVEEGGRYYYCCGSQRSDPVLTVMPTPQQPLNKRKSLQKLLALRCSFSRFCSCDDVGLIQTTSLECMEPTTTAA